MLRNLAITGAVLAAAGLVAPAVQSAEIKIGTFVPEKSVGVSRVIKPWMEAVKKEVGDAVELRGFWGGSLGRSPFKQYELVKNGVADITWVLPGYTPGQFPELQVFELPFMAENGVESSVAAWRLVEAGLVSGFDDTHPIGVWTSAASNFFSRAKITSLYDIKNHKVRSVGSVHARWLDNFGAAPQTMASTKMNEALNRGVIDGLIQGWTGMRTFKSLSLVSYVHEVPVGTIPFILLMNKKAWNGLPDNVKAAFTKHGGLAMARAGGGAYDAVTEKIRSGQMKEGKINFVPADDALMTRYRKDADTEKIRSGQMKEGKINFVPADDALMTRYRKDAAAVHRWWIDKTPNGEKIFAAYKKALEEVRGN